MFSIIRLLVGCIFLCCSALIIKKSAAIHKRTLYIVCAIFSVILTVVLTFLPIENLFVTFDSPKAAYEYLNLGKSNIELVVEGEECDFIVDCKNDSYTYLIIPKTSDGYKIGIGSNTKKVVQKISDEIIICVYQYKNTSDYFITILDTGGGETDISDNYNTTFYPLARKNNSFGKTFVTYYGHFSAFELPYSVAVNGKKIVVTS